MYNLFMLNVTVTEARARMREVLEHVKAGEEVEFSQNGQVVAVLVHPSRLRRPTRTPNTLASEQLMANFNRLKQEKLQSPASLKTGRADKPVKELRLERDGWDG
jgi:prevent-host-death family protein